MGGTETSPEGRYCERHRMGVRTLAARRVTSLAFALVLCCDSSPSQDEVEAYASWLGPQTIDPMIAAGPGYKLERYRVDLRVVEAADFEMPETTNDVVTFSDGEFGPFELRAVEGARPLLVGSLRLEAELGWRFYNLDVRVLEGPLRGALVHLRDGQLPASITDPYVAVYPIPDDVQVDPGPLEFEVVGHFPSSGPAARVGQNTNAPGVSQRRRLASPAGFEPALPA